MNELTIELTGRSKRHLYEQIYDYIKREIVAGRISNGEKLPSTRTLSSYLQVSRATVCLAYDQLLAEGYLESRKGSGFFVCKIDGLYQKVKTPLESETISLPHMEKADYVFSPTEMDLTQFPFDVWKRISREILTDANKELFSLGDPQGEYELRESIREYLHAARGGLCRIEQIIIGAGNDCLLMLLQYILKKDTPFAFENPTYIKAYKTFADAGFSVRLIPMDQNGMRVDRLKESDAKIAYVMPSHQYPTGIVMPVGRRAQLLNWAQESEERYIIEDDYDSEFRHKGKPIPSLLSQDHGEKVIYIGTFSKSVAPAIRISYMVLPMPLLKRYREESLFFSSTVSRIDQRILNEFIKTGAFERYLNRMRKVYRQKHDLLISLLKPFEKKFILTGEYAGLHILLTAKDRISEEDLIKRAAEKKVRVFAMSDHMVNRTDMKNNGATVILGYAGITEENMRKGIEALKEAWLNETPSHKA